MLAFFSEKKARKKQQQNIIKIATVFRLLPYLSLKVVSIVRLVPPSFVEDLRDETCKRCCEYGVFQLVVGFV